MSLVPYVIERSGNGERSYDIFSRLLKDRIVFLSEEVNYVTSSLVIAQLLFLDAQDPDKDIQFYINSPGGSITAGMAIYDTMQHVKSDVSTICVGLCASIMAFLPPRARREEDSAAALRGDDPPAVRRDSGPGDRHPDPGGAHHAHEEKTQRDPCRKYGKTDRTDRAGLRKRLLHDC